MANWNANSRAKRRGREPLVVCAGCGRRIPRDKAVCIKKKGNGILSGDLDLPEDTVIDVNVQELCYCISCAKHRHIFEKLKNKSRYRKGGF